MISTSQIQDLLDNGVIVDQAGDKVGKVGQVFLDDESGNPEWATTSTGFFGTTETFVPLAQAEVEGSTIRVPYSKDQIKGAPQLNDADAHISREQESELYRHYGMQQGGGAVSGPGTGGGQHADTDLGPDTSSATSGMTAGTGTTVGAGTGTTGGYGTDDVGSVGHDTSGPNTDDAMTRSEEQVHVGTQNVATGKARLRKYVVTENVTKTVPVHREEVRVEREPITDANRDQALSGGDLTEEEHEVTLNEERVVVDKETVPVERVRLDKETVTDQEQVSEEVRKEQIETDLPDARTGRA